MNIIPNPEISIIKVGNFTQQTNVENKTYKMLAGVWIAASGFASTCRESNNSAVGYLVPAGKQFRIFGLRVMSLNSGLTLGTVVLSYCSNDIGVQSATARTGQIYLFGGTNLGTILDPNSGSTADKSFELDFVVPAGNYVCVEPGSTGSAMTYIYGMEENI